MTVGPAPHLSTPTSREPAGRLAWPNRMVWFVRIFRAFVRREAIIVSGYRLAFGVRALGFGLSILALVFLGHLINAGSNPHLARYGGNYLAFAVLGLLVLDFQQVGVTRLSQRIRTAQLLGVLEAELATPAPPWMVLGVAPVYEFGAATLRAAGYLVVAWLLFDVRYANANVASVLAVLPLMVAAFAGLGLLSAAVTMAVRRTNPVAAVLGSLSLLLSGVAYPTTVLPPWLRTLGEVLPLTHALGAVRGALLLGASPGELGRPLTALALFAAVLGPAGLATYVWVLRRARVDGSLTHH